MIGEQNDSVVAYLDCDWLDAAVPVGTLRWEMLRGAPKFSFEFDAEWLKRFPDIYLCADLNRFGGRQFKAAGTGLFGCFADAMPDRWGRLLLKRREQILASKNDVPTRTLNEVDYICGLDDCSRMGAFRFKRDAQGDFLNSASDLAVPPITDIRELAECAFGIEEAEIKKLLPEEKWLVQLLKPGSSLGGARPKATVSDEHGDLWVAKFPSRNDDYDVGIWEMFACRLAKRAGISVAETRTIEINGHHALLSRRFDRVGKRRVHFASAMCLLGLRDGDGAQTGHGYLDIADFVVGHCTEVERNLEELFRRIAFNIAIGNCDDHFRNHGFLLTRNGWTLSPAYDLNPTTRENQSLLINDSSDASDLSILLRSATDYFMTKDRAETVIREVIAAVADWRTTAAELRLPRRDAELFGPRFITDFQSE